MNALLFVDDVGSLASGYPRRMFSLPVPARTLVFWPMLYGSATVALLWVATACLVYRPWDSARPGAPAGARAGRVDGVVPGHFVVAAPSLLVAGPGGRRPDRRLGGDRAGPESDGDRPVQTLTALLAVAILAAYPVALAGVASARRGDSWRAWPEWLRPRRAAARSDRRPFRSAFEAQLWYEWRCHGLVLPVAVAGILFFVLSMGSVERSVGPPCRASC